MASQLTMCNNALAEIAADPINSIDEDSLSARECKRLWDTVISEFLTWAEWDYTTKRETLAVMTNDRLGEWLYRYAKPSDLSDAIKVIPAFSTQLVGLPQVGPFTAPMLDALGAFPFEISEDAIYTNVTNAVLQYHSTEVSIGKIRPLEARAIELELASRLAMPIKKSRELKGDLIKQAEVARQRAVAECQNRAPVNEPGYISAVEWAREGLIDGELVTPHRGL